MRLSVPHRRDLLFGCLAGILLILAFSVGCGRKLPPLPPALPDPIQATSIKFEGNVVEASGVCNVAHATVYLLGKPKGICPICTDDLEIIDKKEVNEPGEVSLKDREPKSDYMVYRLKAVRESEKWITAPQIVVKK
jgi:hypothetical protein